MLPSLAATRVTQSRQASPHACWAAGADGAWGAEVPAAPASKLQALFDLAQSTFMQEQHPSRQQVEQLQRALADVPLEELGVAPAAAASAAAAAAAQCGSPGASDGAAFTPTHSDRGEPRPPITYLHIHEDENVSLGIFCLPAGAQIPLHNHPGMTVLSRVLYGALHVRGYDWFDPDAPGALPREARRVVDATHGPSDLPTALFPTSGGNIHKFTAVADCAVLDILSPPYCTDDGRDCTYYREISPQTKGGLSPPRQQQQEREPAPGRGDRAASEVVVLLEEFDPPRDFVINSGEYEGLCLQTARPLPRVPSKVGMHTHNAHSHRTQTSVLEDSTPGGSGSE